LELKKIPGSLSILLIYCRILQKAVKSLVLFGNLEEVWNGLESESEVKINTNKKLNLIEKCITVSK